MCKYGCNTLSLWEKMCLRSQIFCMPRGNKGFRKLLNVNVVRENIDSPPEHYASFPSVTRKCRHLPGKSIEHIFNLKVLNLFVYTNDEITGIFSNLEPGARPKLTHAYYVFCPLRKRRIFFFVFFDIMFPG